MTQDEYNQLLTVTLPNTRFKRDWFSYSSFDFGQTFLPNIKKSYGVDLSLYDGASILGQKTFNYDSPNVADYTASIFTFPVDSEINQKRNLLQPANEELLLFIGININDALEVSFKSGRSYKSNNLFAGGKISLKQAEEMTFQMTINELSSYFANDLSFKQSANLVLSLVGADEGLVDENFSAFLPENLEAEYSKLYSAAESETKNKCSTDLYLEEFSSFISSLSFGTVKNLDAELEIFRSQSQMSGLYGSDDSEYLGEFGFDRYDKTVDGSGVLSNRHFPEILQVKKDFRPVILSLWAPKSNLPSIMSSDTGFTPVSKCDLVFKVTQDPSKNTSKNSGVIYFDTGNPKIKINGFQSGEIKKNGTDPFAITDTGNFEIECTEAITNHEFVLFRESDDTGRVLAVLVVVPNNKVYSVGIKLVDVSLTSSISLSQQKKTHYLASSLKQFCNSNSFNQAFIYTSINPEVGTFRVTRSSLKYVTTEMNPPFDNWVLRDKKSPFHSTVLSLYNRQLIKNSGSNIDKDVVAINALLNKTETGSNKSIKIQKKKLGKSLKSLGSTLSKKFNNTYRKEEFRLEKTWTDPEVKTAIDDFKTNRLAYKTVLIEIVMDTINANAKYTKYLFYKESIKDSILKGTQLSTSNSAPKIDISNTIYTFLYKDIESFRDSETSSGVVAGFTLTDFGYAHILNNALAKASTSREELIVHEFGHAFNLHHTFDSDKQTSDIQNEFNNFILKSEERRDNELKGLNKKGPSDKALNRYYVSSSRRFDRMVTLSKSFKYDRELNDVDSFELSDDIIQHSIDSEKKARGRTITSMEIVNRFNSIKKDLEENRDEKLKETLDIAQGDTKENYMDYDVSRRNSFWYWQWVKMNCGGQPLKEHEIK